eukprot:3118874-Alexandrium_andersonii.AAC.1
MRTCLGRSKVEPRGPRNGLSIYPRSSGGVCSAPLFAQMPLLPPTAALREANFETCLLYTSDAADDM